MHCSKKICTLSCNFKCVICKALFDSFEELKIHVVEHQEYNCFGLFGIYEEQWAYRITFCKSEILSVECEFCTKTDQDCKCARIPPVTCERANRKLVLKK